MRIRIINEKDWEKSYELDKSIIRVGSQITCDIMISDPEVPALMMQITRSGTIDIRNTMRFFTENVTLTRGEQTFPPDLNMPYEVLDGDKITFSRYRMIIELESDKSRVRQSEHMRAEMFLSDRDLAPDSPISGGLLLKNLGTQRPCQFRLNIKGIPEDCLYSSPLPYLHPGASSSVGFTISHLKTRPAPGFHTVSITLSAPDDYYGEMLEFNQDIYVYPVFDNVMILEDDTDKLSGAVRKNENGEENPLPEPVAVQPDMSVQDSGMMNLDESVFASNASQNTSVRVLGKESNALNPSFEDEDDEEELPGYRRKKERVVVIHGDDENLFDGESPEELRPAAAPQEEQQPEAVTAAEEVSGRETKADPADSKPDREENAPNEQAPDTGSAVQSQERGPETKQKQPEPEEKNIPEEARNDPVPRKEPVKFKPNEFVVYSAKKDAFDEEPSPEGQVPAAEPAPETMKDAEAAPSDEVKPDTEKKPEKKSSGKKPEITEPLSEPESENTILVLESSPAKHEDRKETVPADPERNRVEPLPEDEIPAEELPAEKQFAEEEPDPEDKTGAEENPEEEQSPSEEQAPKEIIPEEEPAPAVNEEAETAVPEEPEAAPVKKTRKKSPAKEPVTEEKTSVEKAPSDEEKPTAEEKAPAELTSAEELTPEAELSVISEKEAEAASSEEVTPAPAKKQRKKSAVKEQEIPQPEEEPSPEDKKSAEETVPEETPAAEEQITEQTPAEGQMIPERTPSTVETMPEETPSAEETSAEAGVFAEEQIPEEEPKAENPSPEKKPQVPVLRHSADFDEFSAGEADDPSRMKGKPSETEQAKPAIRVVKGGSFD